MATDEAAAHLTPGRAAYLALRRTWAVLRGALIVTEDQIAEAVCVWHHDRSGRHPTPCVNARREAAAVFTFLTGRLRDGK